MEHNPCETSDLGHQMPSEEFSETHELELQDGNTSEIDPRMDGGLICWSQVVGSWIIFANTWGLTNSFGAFQSYYTHSLLQDTDPVDISWIGTVQIFLLMLVGVFAGPLLDAGHLRVLLVLGTFMTSLGLFMLSLCRVYWQIFLAQAVCVGLGSGLLGLISAAIIPLYFHDRRMLATGIAGTGSSLAGIVYPLIVTRLINHGGFALAVRVLAAIVTASLAICIPIIKLRRKDKHHRKIIQLKHLRDLPFLVFCFGYLFMMASAYVPFFYVDIYAVKLGLSETTASYILSAMNAAGLFGRLALNHLADRYGGLNILLHCCLVSTLLLFLFRLTQGLIGLVVLSIFFGFISGGMVTLPPITIASITKDKTEYGTRMGLGFAIASVGGLIGNPASAAAQKPNGSSLEDVQREFQGTWFVAGSLMAATFCAIMAAKLLGRKR